LPRTLRILAIIITESWSRQQRLSITRVSDSWHQWMPPYSVPVCHTSPSRAFAVSAIGYLQQVCSWANKGLLTTHGGMDPKLQQ
jgi:hypothetical protein